MKRSSAFTLLELLIAVSVFAIVLAAINGVFYSAIRLRNRAVELVDRTLPVEQALTITAQIGPTIGLTMVAAVMSYIGYKVAHRYRMGDGVPRMTVRQLTDKLAAGEQPVIVDLRSLAARQQEPGIPGAVSLALEEMVTHQHGLPRDRMYRRRNRSPRLHRHGTEPAEALARRTSSKR